jgi:hypothetical protein
MQVITFNAAETIALVFLSGFAIQQILQILDPVLIWRIRVYKDSKPTKKDIGDVHWNIG